MRFSGKIALRASKNSFSAKGLLYERECFIYLLKCKGLLRGCKVKAVAFCGLVCYNEPMKAGRNDDEIIRQTDCA